MKTTSLAFVSLLLWAGVTLASEAFVRVRPELPNSIAFEPVEARFLRFDIFSTNQNGPCLDELEVFAGPESENGENADNTESGTSENLARRSGVKASATSAIEGYAIHKVEHLNDGRYGNDASWVAAGIAKVDSPESIQYEWPEKVTIGRVIFSRDRTGRFNDRTPLDVEILLSDDGENWTSAAVIHGTFAEIGGGFTPAGSAWLRDLPVGGAIDLARLADDLTGKPLSDYDRSLREAFLAEENALLKTAGFAACEAWLLQRHYPEYVEPKSQPENILPLATVSDAPDLNAPFDAATNTEADTTNAFWERASKGTVWGFSPGNFATGPVVEQKASALIVGETLFLRITGNRFLSDHLALVSSENLPTRGFVCLREGKIFWRQIDPLKDRTANAELPLTGRFDAKTLTAEAAIPLEFFPEYRERGIYVGLGIGTRHTASGGHPVHFKPADFTLALSDRRNADGQIVLRSEATGAAPIELENKTLTPNTPRFDPVKTCIGQVGPETLIELTDENKNVWRLVGFEYDPCYRPLCQLTDSLKRLEAPESENLDAKDFQKRAVIPGVLNPRYNDAEKIVAELGLPNESEALRHYCAELKNSGPTSDDPLCDAIKKELIPLWERYEQLQAARRDGNADPAGERALFWEIRLLKRKLFLSNDELESVEHLLANKRHPFHPSHNYSDLFDSTWRSGGAVVRIDIPRIDGRLAPENAVTTELVQAGNGVIRNPSASLDGTKIFYALRASQNDYFRIFELDLTTGQTRRISADGPFHDFWPTELPDGGLAFISTRCRKKFICWRPQAFVLHRMNKNGGDITPLSFANLTEFAPSVMNDGRLLWTRSEYVDKGADYGHTLWTIRIDGTMPELVFGNTINLPQGYANGREVPETREVCCVMISHFGDLNGPVALLDLTKGPHDPAAIRSITPEVPWPGFWAKSETFREPFPISRDVILVAHAALDRFGTYLIDRFGNRELLTIDEAIDTVCPQIFAQRQTPPILRGVIKPDLAKEHLGQFSVANVYRGLEGQVEPGAAKYLRVCREMPTPLAQMPDGTYQWDLEPFMEYYASPVDILQGPFGWPSYVAKGVIGTVEIEKDGSADFLAPAEEVLFFQLLDENYNEIQRMRSVVQLQNGEQRSCIGCHESRLSTPEGALTLASKNPGQTLAAPPWGAGPFWYEKAVQPILDRKCVECHTAQTASENSRQFDLTGTLDGDRIPASYRSLIQSGDVHYFDYTWGAGKTTKAAPYSFGTPKSRLWEILRDENHQSVSLTPDEEQAIKCWTDLNVPLWGDYQFRRTRPAGGGIEN